MARKNRKNFSYYCCVVKYYYYQKDDRELNKYYYPKYCKKTTNYLLIKLSSFNATINTINPLSIYFSIVVVLISLLFTEKESGYKIFCLLFALGGVSFISLVHRTMTIKKYIIERILKERESKNCFKFEIKKIE